MYIAWGIVLIFFTLILCWLAQIINAFSPKLATRLGLNEPETGVDPTFSADTRGEAIWDAMILWLLPVAGLLLIMNNPWWSYFGLAGGSMLFYVAGRGIIVRLVMKHRRIPIGKPGIVSLYLVVLTLWGLISVVTVIMAVAALSLTR